MHSHQAVVAWSASDIQSEGKQTSPCLWNIAGTGASGASAVTLYGTRAVSRFPNQGPIIAVCLFTLFVSFILGFCSFFNFSSNWQCRLGQGNAQAMPRGSSNFALQPWRRDPVGIPDQRDIHYSRDILPFFSASRTRMARVTGPDRTFPLCLSGRLSGRADQQVLAIVRHEACTKRWLRALFRRSRFR